MLGGFGAKLDGSHALFPQQPFHFMVSQVLAPSSVKAGKA